MIDASQSATRLTSADRLRRRGDDTIIGSQAGDFLAGGSGDDTSPARAAIDQIYGDSGVNVDLIRRDADDPDGQRAASRRTPTASSRAPTRWSATAARTSSSVTTAASTRTSRSGVGPDGYSRPARAGEDPDDAAHRLARDRGAANGAGDTIAGNLGNDIILGGGGGDIISGNEGNDLVFGDYGRVDEGTTDVDIGMPLLPLSFPFPHPFTWTSIDTGAAQGGGDDLIRGNAGDDIVLGGQGADRITGGDGDDDLIGGHNVAGGSDAGDFIDGGAGNDWIAGDNADILRTGQPRRARGSASSPATRSTTPLGNALVTAAPQVDPNAANEERVGHAVRPLRDAEPPARSATTYIAGGAEDDVIFGQLGDDWIQGDGSRSTTPARSPSTCVATRLSVEDWAGIDRDGATRSRATAATT